MEPTDCTYTRLLHKLDDIELALNKIDAASIQQLAAELNDCLEAIKIAANENSCVSADTSSAKKHITPSTRVLIEAILNKNTTLTNRIKSITALQRSEMHTVKLGRETAKGYASQRPSRTGSIIDSSN